MSVNTYVTLKIAIIFKQLKRRNVAELNELIYFVAFVKLHAHVFDETL